MQHDNNIELPRTRAEAKEARSIHYYTGKPCKHGHLSNRLASNCVCIECVVSWHADNRDMLLVGKRARYQRDRDKALEYAKDYRKKHPDRVRSATRKWKAKNPEKLKEDWANWYAVKGKERDARIRATPRGRLDGAMSRGIYGALKGSKGGQGWETLVGYSLEQLMRHLKKLFSPGMTFDNYGKGGWHVDHITPKVVFNYTSPEHHDFKRCWALKNLQPLWEPDNLSKWAKLTSPFQPSLAIH